MSLDGTYTGLKASVAAFLNRQDLTSVIPDFIALAEESFNNTLRLPGGETRANFTIVSEYATMPTDFLEFRSGYIGSPRVPLAYLSPDMQTAQHSNTDTRVQYFSVAGNSFRFDPLVATGDVVITYYAKIPPLALNAGNWLLTRSPTLYLYESCFHGYCYIQDEAKAMDVKRLAEAAKADLIAAGKRSAWGPAMAMRAA